MRMQHQRMIGSPLRWGPRCAQRSARRLGISFAAGLVALALLALAPPAQAKVVTSLFGPKGTLGGQLGNPHGIAINQTGAGGVAPGTIYVIDGSESNFNTDRNRIERLAPDRSFERAWGFDVIQAGKPGDTGTGFEICTVAADCKAGTASKTVANGGQLDEPKAIAVNQSSGDVYVLSPGSHRVDQFDADGDFIRAWGVNAVTGGGSGDVPGTKEQQTITVDPTATSGKFELSFAGRSTGARGSSFGTAGSNVLTNVITARGAFAVGQAISSDSSIPNDTTITAVDTEAGTLTLSAARTVGGGPRPIIGHDIPYNASAAEVQAKLEGLSTIGAGNVSVSGANGGPYTVTFEHDLADTNVSLLEGSGGGLHSSAHSLTIATTVTGAPGGFEVCSVASQCRDAVGTEGAGAITFVRSLAIDPAGNVWTGGNNHRFEEFGADGHFIAAYGWDVVPPGKPGVQASGNAQQTVTLNANTTGGTFKLSLKSSAGSPIATGATAAAVQSALEGASTIGAGNVSVSGPAGGPWQVTFTGALVDTALPQLSADSSSLLGPQTVSVQNADGGSFNLQFGGTAANNTSLPIAFNAGAAEVQSALEGASTIGVGNVSVSGPDGGPWQVSFVGSLAGKPQPAMTAVDPGLTGSSPSAVVTAPRATVAVVQPGSGLEKCTSTAPGDCRAGVQGAALGQFGGIEVGSFPSQIEIDSAGNVYALDQPNNRIEKFNPTVTSASLFGSGLPKLDNAGPLVATGGDHFLLGVQATDGTQLLELDSSGGLLETSLAGAGAPSIEGLAQDEATGTIYATAQNYGEKILSAYGILVVDDGSAPQPPIPSVDPITAFDDASATLSGTVDPNGFPVTSCKFQYSTDEAGWTDVPVPCTSLDPEGGPQPLSAEIKDLEPGTHYFVRLVASQPYVAESAVASAEQEFTALSLPPILSGVGAALITDTSAYLVGDVVPRSQLTHYRFQYTTAGFDECGAETNPACRETAEGEISGSDPAAAVTKVSGLQPDTEYQFKLVAANVAGSTESTPESFHTRATAPPVDVNQDCPNQAIREAQGATYLPDCRAYEMVSPPEKNGGGALSGFRAATVGVDGNAVGYCTSSVFGEPSAQQFNLCADYVARRGADGWRTRSVFPRMCGIDFEGSHGSQNGFVPQVGVTFSANVDAAAISLPEFSGCPSGPLDPAAPMPAMNLYREDLSVDPFDYQLLAPVAPAGAQQSTPTASLAAASPDFSHIFYVSAAPQVSGAPAGVSSLYEWDEGTLSLASRDTSNAPFAGGSMVSGADANAVSTNGKRVFFSNQNEIYLRQGGAITYDVSQSECSASCGTDAPDLFQWATPTGNKVLFTSKAKLTNDATGGSENLYLYTHSARPVVNQNLTLLSKDSEPGDGSAPKVLGMLGASDDGSTVYFAAESQLVAGATLDVGPKLYRWRAGGSPALAYLGSLSPGNADAVRNWGASNPRRAVTPDGRHLLVFTTARLGPHADRDEDADAYRWDEGDGWRCISCQIPGVPSAGDATDGGVAPKGIRERVSMSDDGRVFFTSGDALVPTDVNGDSGCPNPKPNTQGPYCADVYEWHEGTLSLITPGISLGGVSLLGISPDGRNVFFYVRDRLVGNDTDAVGDIYDARIDGGYPEPAPAPVSCEGSACRAAGSAAGDSPGAGSAAFEGVGNPSPKATRSCPKGKRRVSRQGKVRCLAGKHKHRHRKHERRRRAAKHETRRNPR